MPATLHPARRTLLSTAAAVAVGACLIGGVGVAYAAAEDEPPTMQRASYATTTAAFTPFRSAADAEAAAPMQDVTAGAEARAQVQAALDDAAAAQDEVAASGLPVEGETTIDTAALSDGIAALDAFTANRTLLMTDPTAQAMADMGTVVAATADLRARLQAATEKKAAEDAAAAEAAAAEEARQAAAAAAAAAQPASSSSSRFVPPSAPIMAGDPRAIGAELSASLYGWGADQFSCLDALWQKESGWNPAAYNSGSGAYGIPQALPGSKMATAGADWQTNPATQITWGLGYIAGRYGTPCGAWGHSQSTGWY